MRYIKKNLVLIILIILGLNLNSIGSLISIIFLLYIGLMNIEWSLKSLTLSFLLASLNPSLFHSNFGPTRTILNIILMLYITCHPLVQKKAKKIFMINIFYIYSFYIVFFSFLVSWIPLVSLFKSIYFCLGFISIVRGINATLNCNWSQYMKKYCSIIIVINTLLIALPIGYSTNKVAFNGIFSNPNLLGIFCVIALGIFLYTNLIMSDKYDFWLIFITIVQILFSKSRTSILVSTLLFFYYLIIKIVKILKEKKKKSLKYLAFTFILVSITIVLLNVYKQPIINYITDIILKGQETSEILISREDQITQFINDFSSYPILGVGFGVDGRQGRETSLQFAFSYPVERGNIIFAVLAETGIVGFILFVFVIISIIYNSIKNNKIFIFTIKNIILFASILISLGEMTFFSGNSIGILQWFLLGIYISKTSTTSNNKDNSILIQ